MVVFDMSNSVSIEIDKRIFSKLRYKYKTNGSTSIITGANKVGKVLEEMTSGTRVIPDLI
jgi:hypothetical protein